MLKSVPCDNTFLLFRQNCIHSNSILLKIIYSVIIKNTRRRYHKHAISLTKLNIQYPNNVFQNYLKMKRQLKN